MSNESHSNAGNHEMFSTDRVLVQQGTGQTYTETERKLNYNG